LRRSHVPAKSAVRIDLSDTAPVDGASSMTKVSLNVIS
jgi:hypothetical protein